MRKEMNLDSMEDLEKAAEAQGISFEDFKQNLRNQIITQQVIGREVGQKLVIDKDEEQKYYKEHQKELFQPEEIKLSEILISTEKKTKAATEEQQLQAAKTKADNLLDQIHKGAKLRRNCQEEF